MSLYINLFESPTGNYYLSPESSDIKCQVKTQHLALTDSSGENDFPLDK